MVKHTELQKQFSIRDFEQTHIGGEAGWEKVVEAQNLFQQIKAYKREEKIFQHLYVLYQKG